MLFGGGGNSKASYSIDIDVESTTRYDLEDAYRKCHRQKWDALEHVKNYKNTIDDLKKDIYSSNRQHERVDKDLLQTKEKVLSLKREKRALKEEFKREKERYEREMGEPLRLEEAEISLGHTQMSLKMSENRERSSQSVIAQYEAKNGTYHIEGVQNPGKWMKANDLSLISLSLLARVDIL